MKTALLAATVLCPLLCADVVLKQEKDRVQVEIDGQPFTTFFYGPTTPKPYLHPLRSAAGKQVTRGFPVSTEAGDSTDHPHHRGLWFTHGDVNGTDFWMNEFGQRGTRKGKVVLKKIEPVKGGKDSGVIKATFTWLDKLDKPILTEERTMTFYGNTPGMRIMDFDARLKAIAPVKFGDTKEGFFAIRLADSMSEKMAEKFDGKMTNAEGASGMKAVWGKRSPWVDYTGKIGEEKVGVAILDHPENPKHPTFWHARDYGLFAANPFGEHDFFDDKNRDGSLSIKPGDELRFRYRVIIHGPDQPVAPLFEKYAK